MLTEIKNVTMIREDVAAVTRMMMTMMIQVEVVVVEVTVGVEVEMRKLPLE